MVTILSYEYLKNQQIDEKNLYFTLTNMFMLPNKAVLKKTCMKLKMQ